jgi:hypothetical protein
MQRILAGTLACAVMVPLLTSCATKRTQRNENQPVAVSAQPLGKETGATVRMQSGRAGHGARGVDDCAADGQTGAGARL